MFFTITAMAAMCGSKVSQERPHCDNQNGIKIETRDCQPTSLAVVELVESSVLAAVDVTTRDQNPSRPNLLELKLSL